LIYSFDIFNGTDIAVGLSGNLLALAIDPVQLHVIDPTTWAHTVVDISEYVPGSHRSSGLAVFEIQPGCIGASNRQSHNIIIIDTKKELVSVIDVSITKIQVQGVVENPPYLICTECSVFGYIVYYHGSSITIVDLQLMTQTSFNTMLNIINIFALSSDSLLLQVATEKRLSMHVLQLDNRSLTISSLISAGGEMVQIDSTRIYLSDSNVIRFKSPPSFAGFLETHQRYLIKGWLKNDKDVTVNRFVNIGPTSTIPLSQTGQLATVMATNSVRVDNVDWRRHIRVVGHQEKRRKTDSRKSTCTCRSKDGQVLPII
jgi:hypothetical protein